MDMDEYDPWSKGRDTSEALGSEMDSFSTQPIDIISENILLDAPLKQHDTSSILMQDSLHSNRFESKTRDPSQDPRQRSYRGHSLSFSEILELQDIAMPHYALSNATKAREAEWELLHI